MLQTLKRLKKTLIMNLQPPIESAFNYVPPSDALEGFNEKRDIFCKGKSPVNSKKVAKAKRSKHTKKVSYTPQTSKEEQNL
ncbi:hypothetical protein G6F57_000183 [Rhizopus arrhizus]|uniref:Uncharacterized protein n=1 Tax=Rhizopus oryzae TaxID=64495 RepID=A0A9P7BXS5_RHIOR|nr:hypothetical protein G6F23_004515 [Rhizopus arrhizus]KAG1388878.1 hypothetical protein G6F58_013415 [Rhizopus delemar]KAG0762069.1 hypothetical protein G6F24_007082 [Rhizopus arrhizus]KAG0772546.1 hypothetical protein G6F22_015654 [Rhizopus arrhizus]KAG0790116.1 hypothetical protein G6F21_006039 [Rhizopus arrhizus]